MWREILKCFWVLGWTKQGLSGSCHNDNFSDALAEEETIMSSLIILVVEASLLILLSKDAATSSGHLISILYHQAFGKAQRVPGHGDFLWTIQIHIVNSTST